MISKVALARVLFRLLIVMVMLSVLMGNDAFLTDALAVSGATITVNNSTDNVSDEGKCDLREAITAANTNVASGATAGECIAGSSLGADTINFSVSFGTIVLNSSLPPITGNLTIDGSGHAMALHGQGLYQVFRINGGEAVTIQGLTIFNGYDGMDGGGLFSSGAMTITNNTVSEASAYGTMVGSFSWTDPNAGETHTYSFCGGTDDTSFMIIDMDLLTAAGFDFESKSSYSICVRVTDGALSLDETFGITITDINETPVITSDGGGATASRNVAENSTAVTTVTATDPDAGAILTYSLLGGADMAKFSIHSSTGALGFLTAPDFESPTDVGGNNVYDVTVQVSDGLLSDSQAIAVTVTDVEIENAAPTDLSLSNNTVSENMAAGYWVGTFSTTDPNGGDTHTYSFCGGTDDTSFAIDNIYLYQAASTFDFESKSSFSICVRTTDDGALSFDKTFGIIITDINEPPVITSDGGGATASRNVAENITAVTTVIASDPDAGTTLTYSLLGGADMTKFSINSSTGALAFLTAPNFESPTDVGGNNVYDVTVQVSDGLLSDSQAIAVTVTNVNETIISRLRSAGAQDGWILETGESTNLGGSMNSNATTLRLGDDAARKQYRSILSFSTYSLPDTAVLTKVTLRLKWQGSVGVGNPLAIFQGFKLDIRKGTFGTASLQTADWQTTASRSYGPFTPALVSGWYSIDLTSAKGFINKLLTGSGLTQIRLRFNLDDNNNGAANYLSLYSGNAGTTFSPQLIIEYYMP